jgi:hypothetical protein
VSPALLPEVPDRILSAPATVVNVSRRESCDVYAGRAFAGRPDQGWGNPHRMRGNSSRARAAAIAGYWQTLQERPALLEAARALSGQRIGCWCAPLPCHGHLLAAVASGLDDVAAQWAADLSEFARTAPLRLLVTGSRHWTDHAAIANALNAQHRKWNRPADAVLVVGDCEGADTIAAASWKKAGLPVDQCEARWSELGLRAGPDRNRKMVESGVDECLAFPIGVSKGTRGCVKLARSAGVPVTVIEGDGGIAEPDAAKVPDLFDQ